jgi:hypothetical protein
LFIAGTFSRARGNKGDNDMANDTPPLDHEVLEAIGGQAIEPHALVEALSAQHSVVSVIEALQRCIERGKISLNAEGMVVPAQALAYAA